MSKSAVARKLGISRNTVARYANKPDGYTPVIEKQPQETSVDPYLPYIRDMLQTAKDEDVHIPTTVIYDAIKQQGYDGSLRWLQQVIGKHEIRSRILAEELVRFETEPGKQMQVDWIEFPKDNLSAFVATMGHSRASYVQYITNEKIETLIECHLNAFKYFGGVPQEGLYDNMRTVIIKRNAYGYGKHQLNAMFEDFAKHCGFKIKVCKPYRAKTKGKVEKFNHYLRYSFHNGLRVKLAMKNYELNIDNANSEVIKWLDNIASFPAIKTLEEFDYNFTVGVNSKQINELASLEFVRRCENIILLGQSGVGKTHLAIALAYKAVQNRYKVKFITTADLLSNAVTAKRDKRYDSFLKSVLNPSILIIDELGYFNMTKEESNHFFQIISKRYEKGSTIITSNLVFSKWKQVFGGDKIVTTAILDRVLHHSHVINIQGDSYRLKEQKEAGKIDLDLFKNEEKSHNKLSDN